MIPLSVAGHLRAGIDSVRNAKLRSFWTMLGIVIGVTSVISVVAIGEGIKQQVGGQIHQYGPDLITVRSAQINTGNSSDSNYQSLTGLSVTAPLTIRDITTVSQVRSVSATAPLTIASGVVRGASGPYSEGYVIGTSSDLPRLLNQSLAYGTFFGPGDNDNNVAVLGQTASLKMFNEDVPLGRSFTFHGQNFIVDGIFDQFNSSPLSGQANFNNAIFIPNGVAEGLSNDTAPTYEILARASDKNSTKAVAHNIQSALAAAHGSQSGFSVLTGNQNLQDNNSILGLLTDLIAGVAAISLLVGAIGIMNVMLVSVAERVREIGIRKAVGATNRQILSQFMVESGLLSLVGGLIGVGLALLIDLALRLSTSLRPDISWQLVLIVTGLSLLIGVVFGTVPAVKAARKDPIEALRAE